MSEGLPIGFEMAEKNMSKQTNRQTDRHFRIYISRDLLIQRWLGELLNMKNVH